jgi:hypothetical protein
MADEYVSIKSAFSSLCSAPHILRIGTSWQLSHQDAVEAAEIKKKRTFRKFSYRGIDLDQYDSFLIQIYWEFKGEDPC